MHLIFLDSFRSVHIPSVNTVKFLSLTQFPVDHLPHPIMHSLIFLLCQFTVFASYVINYFISDITKPAFAIFLHIIIVILLL